MCLKGISIWLMLLNISIFSQNATRLTNNDGRIETLINGTTVNSRRFTNSSPISIIQNNIGHSAEVGSTSSTEMLINQNTFGGNLANEDVDLSKGVGESVINDDITILGSGNLSSSSPKKSYIGSMINLKPYETIYGRQSTVGIPYWKGPKNLSLLIHDAGFKWGSWDQWLDNSMHGHASCKLSSWSELCRFFGKPTPPSPENQELIYPFMNRHVPVVRKWLCSSATLPSKSVPHCFCDKECILFGDCCVDAFNTTDGLATEVDIIKDTLKQTEKLYEDISEPTLEAAYLSLFHKYSSCHKININDSDVTLWLINKCPKDQSEDVNPVFNEKCINKTDNILSILPGTLGFSKKWQIVFRNVYCAFCHGFEKDDIVLWNVHARCRANINVTNAHNVGHLVSRSCTLIYKQPGRLGELRRCIMKSELRSECNLDSAIDLDINSCQAYLAPVSFNAQMYKNIHCAYCDRINASRFNYIHAVSDVNHANTPETKPQMIINQAFGKRPTGGWFSPGKFEGMTPKPEPMMKVLFDFSFQAGLLFSVDGSSKVDATRQCLDEEVYDFASETCKTVVCAPGFVLREGKCQYANLAYVYNEEDIVVPLDLSGNESFIISVVSQDTDADDLNGTVISQSYSVKLKELLMKQIKQKDINVTTDFKLIDNDSIVSDKFVSNRSALASYLHIKTDSGLELADVIQLVTKFTRLISRGSTERSLKVKNVFLSNGNMDQEFDCPRDRHVSHLTNETITTIHVNDTVYFVDEQMKIAIKAVYTIFSLKFMPEKTSKPFIQDVVICSELVCPQIRLSEKEYTLDNGSLQIVKNGKRLSPSEYDKRNDSVYICITLGKGHFVPYFEMPNALLLEKVTYSLSIVALILTIFIYVKYVSLRTLHGKTLVSLSVSLIGAQLTSILPIPMGGIWCKLAAIVAHFSWLAAFGWMSMISYDMVATFFGKQTAVTSTHVDRKRYLSYSFVGWILPGLIVSISIVLHNVSVPSSFFIGYGRWPGGCFITGKGIFMFFSIPNLISMLFNVVAFILTVYGIAKKSKIVPNSKRSKDRCFFLIYVKLSVVMGVSWIFAILASITEQTVLWYIHIVLNGLQGVFVFISFALRATIWRKMNIKILKNSPSLMFRSKKDHFYSVSGNSVSLT